MEKLNRKIPGGIIGGIKILSPTLTKLETNRLQRLNLLRYSIAIFIGSFLLFQVQPIAARYILPWFGGGASVWTTCMLFFQVFLLGGYAYAYLLTKYLPLRKQVVLHLLLLACSLIVLPITPAEAWKPIDAYNPAWRILLLLFFTIGGPFLLLSSTGPLIQMWFAGERPGQSPYRLFALSNFAALLALLTYPFLVEPHLGLDIQTKFWSLGYILYVVAVGWCAALIYQGAAQNRRAEEPVQKREIHSGGSPVFLWLVLSACGVIVLLASTNELTQNIFPVPFLWILPLSLYLVSFILCFDSDRWYVRRIWVTVFFLSFLPAVFLLHLGKVNGLAHAIFLNSVTLFSACMICHGELARLKPSPKFLASFYLMIAFGGALGSVFVNLIAPSFFSRYWEYPIGLFGVYLLAGICRFRDTRKSAPRSERKSRKRAQQPETTFLRNPRTQKVIWGTAGMVFVVFYGITIYVLESNDLMSNRNFYGRLHVTETENNSGIVVRSLMDGQIMHGEQIVNPQYRLIPTLYFRYGSGVGVAVRHHNHVKGLRLGVIGLGVGTIAAYVAQGDTLRFYEINPAVERVARNYFYFLQDCRADYEIVLGDARISLERELKETGGQNFHILVVDAFSNDTIPVHLITREAFSLYWKHLRPDGILAFHISNAYLELSPIVRNFAQMFGKKAISIIDEPDKISSSRSAWVLVTSNEQFINNEKLRKFFSPWPNHQPKKLIWTDDYSNLFMALK